MSKKAIYDQICAVDGPLDIGFVSGPDEVFKKAITVEKETGAVTVATTLKLGERNVSDDLNAFRIDLDAVRASAMKSAAAATEANEAAQSSKIAAEQAAKDAKAAATENARLTLAEAAARKDTDTVRSELKKYDMVQIKLNHKTDIQHAEGTDTSWAPLSYSCLEYSTLSGRVLVCQIGFMLFKTDGSKNNSVSGLFKIPNPSENDLLVLSSVSTSDGPILKQSLLFGGPGSLDMKVGVHFGENIVYEKRMKMFITLAFASQASQLHGFDEI